MIKNKKNYSVWKIILILLLILLLLVLFYICKSFLFSTNYFLVKKVNISVYDNVLKRASIDKINKIINENISGNILSIDINKVKYDIEMLPWVDSVNIKKTWRFTIDIFIKEHKPLARWGTCCLIDQNGTIFIADTDEVFPVFEVSDKVRYNMNIKNVMIKAFNDMNDHLKKSNMYIVKLQIKNSNLSWNIVLNNGILVKLGKSNYINKIHRFIQAWDLFLRHHQNNILYIDIRYGNGLSVLYKNI